MSSSDPSSIELFPLARISVTRANERREPRCHVRLAISHRLYWKLVKNDKEPAPTSLYDFKNQTSLAFERLNSTNTWEDVMAKVKPHDNDDLSFEVSGRIHGLARWKTFGGEVNVVITASSTTERNKWMNEIRLRISSPRALHERAKVLINDNGLGLECIASLTDEMKSLHFHDQVGNHDDELTEATSESVDQVTPAAPRAKRLKTRTNFAVPNLDWIEKINALLSSWTGSVALAVKKGAVSSEVVANTAQDVADFAKFIPGGITSVFQLVALSARLVVMFTETARGRSELPTLLLDVMQLLDCVAKSVEPILKPAVTLVEAEKILEGNVFQVLVSTFDLSGKIEEQLMQGKLGGLVNSPVVKEVESDLAKLKQMVVPVALTKQLKGIEGCVEANKLQVAEVKEGLVAVQQDVSEVRVEMQNIKLNSESMGFLSPGLPSRPNPTPFFVGRKEELQKVSHLMEKHGSAAITGLGGVGKTQLMAAFAEQAEQNGDVPGSVFWLTADGEAHDVLESLAAFAEKLHRKKMRNEDRTNRTFVIDYIRKGLCKEGKRWLMCIDNVDCAGKPDVNVILSALTSAARKDGWVILTSRTGSSQLWTRMKSEQNVGLNSLSTEDAMRMLLRLKESISMDENDDEAIEKKLQGLEAGNQMQFEALRELAKCLSGLPLALAQAAAYMRSSKDKLFSEYLQLYKTATQKSEFDSILRQTEDELEPVRKEQRSIFSTWKISVDRLSDEAETVLIAVAMLGSAPIPGSLLRLVLETLGEENEASNIRYERVVEDELVRCSSLLQKYRGDGEDWFEMHRLVRLFVVLSMEQDNPQRWDTELSRVIKSTHSYVADVLGQAGKDFDDDPDDHEDPQLVLLPQIRSIMHHREKRGCVAAKKESLELYYFNGRCLRWRARFREAEEAFDALLDMHKTIHGADAVNGAISASLHCKGTVCQDQGKFEQAEALYNKSLEMLLAVHGSERPNPGVASLYHNLGSVYVYQGKLARAEDMCNKSLEVLLAIHGSVRLHPDVALAYNQLGIIYQNQGKLEQAEDEYYKSLGMMMAIYEFETPHPDVAALHHSLGCFYQNQGRLDEAEGMFNESLAMTLAIYGSERPHPYVAGSYHQLARVYVDQGKLEQAEEMYNKSLQMLLVIHGAETSQTSVADTLSGLGVVLEKQGRQEQALKNYSRALEMYRAVFGADSQHPPIVTVTHSIRRLQNKEDTSNES